VSDPASKIKALVHLVQGILQFRGAESLTDDRAYELTYQDDNIFLLLDESNGKTWVAIPVWDEDQQQCKWESVLDVPATGVMPEKFFTQVIPDRLSYSWTEYLKELHQLYLDDVERCSRIKSKHETERFARRWLGCWNLDIADWFVSMSLLKAAGVDSAKLSLQMFDKIVTMPKELWEYLLDTPRRQEENDGTH